MNRAPFPVAFRLTRHNRNSIAAVLAVLEAELPRGTIQARLISSVEQYAGEGLLVDSFTSLARARAGRELEQLRRRWEDVLAIAGGCHASASPEDALDLGYRWVAQGEAGPAFAQFVAAVARGEAPQPGVIAAEGPLAIDRYGPWPQSGQLFASIELTRGCPMACAFCQTPRMFGRRPRHRSLGALEAILRHSCGTGHRYTRFTAPNAFGYGSEDGIRPEPRAIEALLEASRRAGMERVYLGTFPSEVRPESVRDDVLQIVRERCDNDTLAVGLQSGSERVLKAMKRGHTVAQGVEAIARIAAAGFKPKVDFIFGLPGETDEDRAQTCALIRHLIATYGATVHAHAFTPLPGTPLADTRPEPLDAATTEFLDELTGVGHITGRA